MSTEDAVNGQVVAGKVFEGVFGVEHAGAFTAFAGDEFEVLFAGVEDDGINAVAFGAETGAGVDGVCAIVARADEQQDFCFLLAAEQVLRFGCDGVCGALHEVAVVVGGFDVGLFCFAYLGSSVDELHCCLLGWHRAGLRGHLVWCWCGSALVVGVISGDDAESVAFGVELLQVRQFCVAEVFGGCDGDSHGFVVGQREVDAVDAEFFGSAGDGALNDEVGLATFGGGYFAVLPVESCGCSEYFCDGFFGSKSYGLGAHVPGAFVGGEDSADEGGCFGHDSFESFNVDGIYTDSHNHELHLLR